MSLHSEFFRGIQHLVNMLCFFYITTCWYGKSSSLRVYLNNKIRCWDFWRTVRFCQETCHLAFMGVQQLKKKTYSVFSCSFDKLNICVFDKLKLKFSGWLDWCKVLNIWEISFELFYELLMLKQWVAFITRWS